MGTDNRSDNRFGLIGEKLGHSFSPLLHARFADYKYSLMEISREDIDAYFAAADFDGVNVTIPYKETAMRYCTPDENAKTIGCVNTLVRTAQGVMGYNTDTYGFEYMAKRAGIDFAAAKVAILGSGGTCRTAAATAARLGASSITVVSRHPSDMALGTSCPVRYVSYDEGFGDCDILVNTTPVGMYPEISSVPLPGFVSKYALVTAAFAQGSVPALCGAVALLLAAVLTVIYIFTIAYPAFFMKLQLSQDEEEPRDPGACMKIVFAALAVLLIGAGIFAGPVMAYLVSLAGGVIR